jgi:hypothetical protein
MRFLNIRLLMSIALFPLLLTWGCNLDVASTLARSMNKPMMIRLDPKTFAMNTQGQYPVLQLHSDVCQVHIQSGNGSHIVVHVTVRHYPENHMPTIQYDMSSKRNTLSIDEKLPQPVANSRTDSVLVDMTVPRNIDLSLHNEVGNFEISNVSGQLAIAASTGNILVDKVQLARKSSLITNVGHIGFSGSFAPQGMYSMITNVGSIDLALQGPLSLQVDAQATIGTIHSNLPSLNMSGNISGNIAQGTSGNRPVSRLMLQTQVGSISLS